MTHNLEMSLDHGIDSRQWSLEAKHQPSSWVVTLSHNLKGLRIVKICVSHCWNSLAMRKECMPFSVIPSRLRTYDDFPDRISHCNSEHSFQHQLRTLSQPFLFVFVWLAYIKASVYVVSSAVSVGIL